MPYVRLATRGQGAGWSAHRGIRPITTFPTQLPSSFELTFTPAFGEICAGQDRWDEELQRCVPIECPPGHGVMYGECVPIVPASAVAARGALRRLPSTPSQPPAAPAEVAHDVPVWAWAFVAIGAALVFTFWRS